MAAEPPFPGGPMFPLIPGDSLSGVLEMVCYCFTVAAALLGCLLQWRG